MNRLITVQNAIRQLLREKEAVIVTIDGNCTSGKTTLAKQFADIYDCNVFHLDDFFLRPEQRTPKRLAEIGGNVDYERFSEEVLLPLKSGKPFSYRPFDCSIFELTDPITVIPKKLNIVEGTYSLHPYFGNIYDLKVHLTISPELQRQRILERPEFLHKRFFEEWIPMENRYFEGFDISEKCDIVL